MSERLKRRTDEWVPDVGPDGVLTALDKKTGKVKWTNDKDILGTAVLACDAARRVCIWRGAKLTGFDSDDGKILYTVESWNADSFAMKPPLIANATIHWEKYAFNVKTGENLPY